MAYTQNKQVPGLDAFNGALDGTELLPIYRDDQTNGLANVSLADVAAYAGKEPSEAVTPIYQFSTARRLITDASKAGEIYPAVGDPFNFPFDANGFANASAVATALGGQIGYWGVLTNNAVGQTDMFRPNQADAIANGPRVNLTGFNGRPCMDFIAPGKSLYDRSAVQVPAGNITGQIVFKPGTTTNSQTLFFMRGTSDAQSLALSHNGATNGRIGYYQNGSWVYANTTAGNGTQVISFIMDAVRGTTVLVNGQVVATGLSFASTPFYDSLVIGNSFGTVGPFSGLIAEVRLWGGAMAVSAMQTLDADAMSFYRISTPGAIARNSANTSDVVMVRDTATGVFNEVPISGLPGVSGSFDGATTTALNGLYNSTVNLPINVLIGDSLIPEQFGAVGDGVTDDTVALNRWAQACITYDRTARLSPGATYIITDTVKFLNAQGLKLEGHPTAWIKSDFFPAGYDLSQDKGGNILFLATTNQTLKAGGNKTLDESNGILDNLNAGIYTSFLQVKGASFYGHSQSASGQTIVADGFGEFRNTGRWNRFINPQEVFVSTYSTGTVTVTKDSATVIGLGTLFLANVAVGDVFKVAGDNREYYVRAVNSNTNITLHKPVARLGASGLSYQTGYTQVLYRLYRHTAAGTAGNRPVKGTGAGLLMGTVAVEYIVDAVWRDGWRLGTAYAVNDYLTANFGDLYLCRNAGTSSVAPSMSSDLNTRIGSTRYIERKVQVGKATITNDGPSGAGRVVLTGSPALLTAAQVGDYVRFGYNGTATDRVTVSGATVTAAFGAATGFATAANASVGDEVRFSDDDTPYVIDTITSATQFVLTAPSPVASAVTFNVRGSNQVYQIASITNNNEFVLTSPYAGQLTSDVHCTIGNVVWEFMGDGLRDGDDGICTFSGTRVVHENFTTLNFLDSHLRTPRTTTVPTATRFDALTSSNVRYRNGNLIGGASPHSTTNGGTMNHVLENCYISTNLATKSASRLPNSERMIWDKLIIRHLSNYPGIEIQGYSHSNYDVIISSALPLNPAQGVNILTNAAATYTVGSATFTTGNPIVTGTSSNWLQGGPAKGDTIRLGATGPLYIIASVDSNTQITLTSNYLESTVVAQPYRIYRRAFDMVNKRHKYTVSDFSTGVGYTLTDYYRSVNETFDFTIENYNKAFTLRGGGYSVVEGMNVKIYGKNHLSTSRTAGGGIGEFATNRASADPYMTLRNCFIDFTQVEGTFYFSNGSFNLNPYESTGNSILIPVSVDFQTVNFEVGGRPLNGQCHIPAGTHVIRTNPAVGEVKQWSTVSGGSSDLDKWNVGAASVTNDIDSVTLSGLTSVTLSSFVAGDYIRIEGVEQPIRMTAVSIDTGAGTAAVTLDRPWTGTTGTGLLFHVNPAWQWRATQINGTTWRQTRTTTSYTLTNWDSGSVILFTNSSAITVTLPATIEDGADFRWIQQGTGQITFVAASGATLSNISSHTKSAGQNAEGRLTVRNNFNNTAAAYRLSGETAS
jgi:hypothetical protein